MWTNIAGQYVATGGFDWGSTYTMQHNPRNAANAEQDAYLSAVAAVNTSGWPCYPVARAELGDLSFPQFHHARRADDKLAHGGHLLLGSWYVPTECAGHARCQRRREFSGLEQDHYPSLPIGGGKI
jgi:hypothetical protein